MSGERECNINHLQILGTGPRMTIGLVAAGLRSLESMGRLHMRLPGHCGEMPCRAEEGCHI